jgi:predicted exporter
VNRIVDSVPAPPGIKAYVTGPGPLAADRGEYGDRSVQKITGITVAVIAIMLFIAYRSLSTVLVMLLTVGIELLAARGVIAVLSFNNFIGLSTFAVNILVSLAIAASTDYIIFVVGRYQEARAAGQDRQTAYYTMFGGTAHVILASGLTVSGAMYCLSFTRLPYFKTLGAPCSIGLLVVILAALTLTPAAANSSAPAYDGIAGSLNTPLATIRCSHSIVSMPPVPTSRTANAHPAKGAPTRRQRRCATGSARRTRIARRSPPGRPASGRRWGPRDNFAATENPRSTKCAYCSGCITRDSGGSHSTPRRHRACGPAP